MSNSVCSDNEIWLRHPTAHRRTSGYISAEDTVPKEVEYHPSTDRGQPDRESAQQRSTEDRALKSRGDFIVPSMVYGQQPKPLSGNPTFTMTQNQLMEIVRRACHEVTSTPSGGIPVHTKQLSYSSPHIDADVDLQPAANDQVESNESRVRGRPTTPRHSMEPPPARTRVRWRSPFADGDEFFDARESLSRSRSRSTMSCDRRSTSSKTSDTMTSSAVYMQTTPPGRWRPPNPSDDSGDNKDNEQPKRRGDGRQRSPSPPPDRYGSATTPQSYRKWIKPDKFNGTGSVETFLAQFDICCTHNSWNDRDKAAHLKCCFTGMAGQLLWDTGRPDELTYSELREKLRRRFGSDDQQEKFQAELRARRRHTGKTLAKLYQDIRRLMSLAYPGEGMSSLCEQIAKDYFIRAKYQRT